MRKTKIVCTIGPASDSPEMLKKLIAAGMNVARLNFSHGSHEEHLKRIKAIRRAADEMNANVAILLDTKGPEIRVGRLAEEPVELVDGQTIVLTTEDVVGDASRIPVSYKLLPEDVRVGSDILLDDGLIGLKVVGIDGPDIRCVVEHGGLLYGRKGVNVPGTSLRLPGITEKDAEDIRFGIEQDIDFIAASFVRKAADVVEIRELLEAHDAQHIQIISKIENREGVDHLEEILEVSDGLMVARGDLGVEIPPEEVPIIQKRIIEACNVAGKPVITATQMLDSMQRNPRPTRAEASDVANAIFDGTDAIMLSGETAVGKYPVESVRTMSRIALQAEAHLEYREIFARQSSAQMKTVTEAISQAVTSSALDLGVKAIITSTESGYTARMVSKYRPKVPIIAVTPNPRVVRKMSLYWGTLPLLGVDADNTDKLFQVALDRSMAAGYIQAGDLVIITAGVPVGRSGTTNLMKIHHVGDMVARGQGIGTHNAGGKVVVADSPEEANAKAFDGCILVTVATDSEYMPAIRKAAAVVTETGGVTSHAAIVCLELGIPALVGVERATSLLHDGMEVLIYTEQGIIRSGKANVL